MQSAEQRIARYLRLLADGHEHPGPANANVPEAYRRVAAHVLRAQAARIESGEYLQVLAGESAQA